MLTLAVSRLLSLSSSVRYFNFAFYDLFEKLIKCSSQLHMLYTRICESRGYQWEESILRRSSTPSHTTLTRHSRCRTVLIKMTWRNVLWRTLFEKVRCILVQARLNRSLWPVESIQLVRSESFYHQLELRHRHLSCSTENTNHPPSTIHHLAQSLSGFRSRRDEQ